MLLPNNHGISIHFVTARYGGQYWWNGTVFILQRLSRAICREISRMDLGRSSALRIFLWLVLIAGRRACQGFYLRNWITFAAWRRVFFSGRRWWRASGIGQSLATGITVVTGSSGWNWEKYIISPRGGRTSWFGKRGNKNLYQIFPAEKTVNDFRWSRKAWNQQRG